jgi:uncharacterized membrane protein YciS (DUF1049 family)
MLLGNMDLTGYFDSSWAILGLLAIIFIVGLVLCIAGLMLKVKVNQPK